MEAIYGLLAVVLFGVVANATYSIGATLLDALLPSGTDDAGER